MTVADQIIEEYRQFRSEKDSKIEAIPEDQLITLMFVTRKVDWRQV